MLNDFAYGGHSARRLVLVLRDQPRTSPFFSTIFLQTIGFVPDVGVLADCAQLVRVPVDGWLAIVEGFVDAEDDVHGEEDSDDDEEDVDSEDGDSHAQAVVNTTTARTATAPTSTTTTTTTTTTSTFSRQAPPQAPASDQSLTYTPRLRQMVCLYARANATTNAVPRMPCW